VNKTFYSYDFDFEKINSKIGKSYVVYGDNDPYVPATEPPLFAEKLSSEIHIVPGGKHCGSIFKEFPLLLDMIKGK
jgi:predicted alpha/beta hydrolase family esterase